MSRRATLAGLGLAGLGLACVAPWLHAGAAGLLTVVQAHRAFSVADIHVKRGDTVTFTNDDAFNHHVFVKTPSFAFESAEQAPGETVNVKFPVAGTFDVQCGIHPRMHLAVTVD